MTMGIIASQSCGKNGWLAHDNYFLIVNDVVFEAAMYVSSSVDYDCTVEGTVGSYSQLPQRLNCL
jgi:hypothetical protein